MNRPDSPAADQSSDQLIRRLANGDEISAAEDGQRESTVAGLRGELETMASDLRQPPPDDDFEDESQCRQALEVIKAIGQEPSVAGDAAAAADGEKGKDVVALGMLGQYELVEKIGEGGMGAVYKARHTKLDKIVAIKVLPAEKMKDKQAVGRFEREMRAVGKLEHPNIVRAMDAGEVDGMHFLVMEYVKGRDLSQISKQFGPLPIAEACELIRQAAVGLDEALDNDMVHRDIKPSNLILAQRRRKPPVVKILDMGLALLSDAHGADAGLTTTGQMMGTLDYMAPEQGGDSKNVDIRADIYALGASLYRLLCGEVIYFGEKYTTPVQKMMALAVTPAPPIQERQEGIPDQLAAIVHKMLEKDPDARYATPQEIVDDLEPFCAGADLGWLLTGVRSDTGVDSSLSATELGASSSEVETDITIDRPGDITQPNVEAGGSPASASPVTVEAPADPSAVTITPVMQTDPRAKPQAAKTLPAALRNIPPKLLIASGAGLLGIIGLLAATVFFFQTPNGTLRVEINDPDVEVKVKGEDIVLTNADKEPIKLKAGEHSLVVTRGDFTFETKQFSLKKGDTTTVKIELLPGKLQVVSAGNVIGSSLFDKSDSSIAGSSKDYALQFDGKKSYVAIESLGFDNYRALTMEAIVAPTAAPNGVQCISRFDGESNAQLLRYQSDWYFGINRGDGDSRTKNDEAQSNEVVHLAGVWDGKSVSLFVNGKKCDPPSGRGGIEPFGHRLLLGGTHVEGGTVSGGFNGRIHAFRLSTTARYSEEFTAPARFRADSDTLALYHFDEGSGNVLRDSSGNNHHGKIVGAKWVKVDQSQSSPLEGGALHFDGRTDHVQVDDIDFDGKGPVTIESWLRPQADPQRWQGHSTAYPLKFGHPQDSRQFSLYMSGVKETISPIFREKIRGKNVAGAFVNPQIGEWNHVAAVWSDGKVRIYHNGRRRGEIEVNTNEMETLGRCILRLGHVDVTGPVGFHGEMREVRISTNARYAEDFTPAQRYQPDEHTLALYHFDDGRGDVLRDSSGNNHHGKIVGAKWVRMESPRPRASTKTFALEFADELDRVDLPTLFNKGGPYTIDARLRVPRPRSGSASIVEYCGRAARSRVGINENSFFAHTKVETERKRSAWFPEPVLADMPYHVAATWDGQLVRVYVNGRLAESKWSDVQPAGLRGGHSWIGAATNGATKSFVGTLEEVRISNVVRYGENFVPASRYDPDEHTVALYHFDEGSGDVLHDSSGNDHHGKIVGAKWVRVGLTPPDAPPPAASSFDEARAKAHQKAWADYLGEPVETTNSLGMKLAVIPPGSFKMGWGETAVDVTLTKPFRIGIHEVTQAQWKAVTDSVPWQGKSNVLEAEDAAVNHINWNGATEYCRKLTQREREAGRLSAEQQYRLPTEAEWEWACRAGTTTKYSFGDDGSQLGQYGWSLENAWSRNEKYAHAVGLKKPNPWGLYDMHGNVSEFCSNWWIANDGLSGGTDPTGPADGDGKVHRGGNFEYSAKAAESTGRIKADNFPRWGNGLRVVLSRTGNEAPPQAGTSASGSGTTPATQGAAEPDRAAAEWVIAMGGSVKISTATAKDQMVSAADKLPAEPFHVTIVDLANAQGVDEAGLQLLAGLDELRAVRLTGVAITDAGVAHLHGCKNLSYLAIDGGISPAAQKALTDALPALKLQVAE